jgi:hypothetical protein
VNAPARRPAHRLHVRRSNQHRKHPAHARHQIARSSRLSSSRMRRNSPRCRTLRIIIHLYCTPLPYSCQALAGATRRRAWPFSAVVHGGGSLLPSVLSYDNTPLVQPSPHRKIAVRLTPGGASLPAPLPARIFRQGYWNLISSLHGTARDGDDRQGYRGPAGFPATAGPWSFQPSISNSSSSSGRCGVGSGSGLSCGANRT